MNLRKGLIAFFCFTIFFVFLLSIYKKIETTITRQFEQQFTFILKDKVQDLKNILERETTHVYQHAQEKNLLLHIDQILKSNHKEDLRDYAWLGFQTHMRTYCHFHHKYTGRLDYFLVMPGKKILSHLDSEINTLVKNISLTALWNGQEITTVIKCHDHNHKHTPLYHGHRYFMVIIAPVWDLEGEIIAGLGNLIDLTKWSKAFFLNQLAETGDIYLFASDGTMLSPSRFQKELEAKGVLPKNQDAAGYLKLYDPSKPKSSSSMMNKDNLTLMCRKTIGQEDTFVNMQGYRDYRGKSVIGCAQWLNQYSIGIALEMDYHEAYRIVESLQKSYWLLCFVVICSLMIGGVSSIMMYANKNTLKKIEKIGRYQLVKIIGEGGMGKVYLAKHATLKNPTAIKILAKNNFVDRSRFEREVGVMSKLVHPNTIRIFDYGKTSDGNFYYVMEYLPGMSLRYLVDKFGPISQERMIPIICQVTFSLQEAHNKGFIHRDIKPANILLCQRSFLYDYVKVADFGLTKNFRENEDQSLTKVHTIVGTPLYTSPELIQGSNDVDQRCDIYSLGLVMYYLLSGRNTFEGENSFELYNKHLYEEPKAFRDFDIVVDDLLEEIIRRCLQKHPKDRFQNVEELRSALELCPIRLWTDVESKNWWEKHRGEIEPLHDILNMKGEPTEVIKKIVIESS